ncbi:MAG: ribonuclease H-like domain-containing protein [Ignavibacteria bacterium]
MKELVFDIETVGYPIENFDEYQQEYLLRFANLEETEEKRQQKIDETIRYLNLSALTAQIVAIGLYDLQMSKGLVLFQSENKEHYKTENGDFTFHSGDEKYLIEKFWTIASKYDRFISFNGRNFDAPFLLLRSAILRIKPSKNLLSYRYDSKFHCDLLEQFTFYGLTRKYNLDFYCKVFGIESPKRGDVTGYNINEIYNQKRFREIAEYCSQDLKATKELYLIYKEYLEFNSK